MDAPIPGESLTLPKGQAPYERKVRYQKPEEALQKHLEKLNDPDAMSGIADMLSTGVSLETMVTGILRNAVYNAVHTIDTSLVIAPVIHEYIKTSLEPTGMKIKEWEEGDAPEYDEKQMKVARAKALNVDIEVPQEAPIVETKKKSSSGIIKRREK